ncbi:hypothetical protein BRC86_05520 [Halobacteriales archaeon QS_3_64_16]|nr:MAG: hypothetical protein BRC86_05520 [Halobacteriales archaeon QS_3_64_16]
MATDSDDAAISCSHCEETFEKREERDEHLREAHDIDPEEGGGTAEEADTGHGARARTRPRQPNRAKPPVPLGATTPTPTWTTTIAEGFFPAGTYSAPARQHSPGTDLSTLRSLSDDRRVHTPGERLFPS